MKNRNKIVFIVLVLAVIPLWTYAEASEPYYTDVVEDLNALEIELVDAKSLSIYQWEKLYRNPTYHEYIDFLSLIKTNNASVIHYNVPYCPSANIAEFYFKHQNQSHVCVVVYEENPQHTQSCCTRNPGSEAVMWAIGLSSFIMLCSALVSYLLLKTPKERKKK